MISQWWRVFISPQKKPRPQNNDKSPHMSHLKQVAKMGSLILVVRFRPRCRGIMWNSPTKIVAGSNLSNLAPLADYLKEPVTRKTSCINVFFRNLEMFLCRLDACIEKLLKNCVSRSHMLWSTTKVEVPFDASNQFLDLMTSISQSLQLLNHAETTWK